MSTESPLIMETRRYHRFSGSCMSRKLYSLEVSQFQSTKMAAESNIKENPASTDPVQTSTIQYRPAWIYYVPSRHQHRLVRSGTKPLGTSTTLICTSTAQNSIKGGKFQHSVSRSLATDAFTSTQCVGRHSSIVSKLATLVHRARFTFESYSWSNTSLVKWNLLTIIRHSRLSAR